MPKFAIDSAEIYYEVTEAESTSEPCLLIAGMLSDISTWAEMKPLLTRNFTIIALDNRGIGRSTGDGETLTIKQMAADAAALLDYLQIPQAHVLGHSMGGQIAQELVLAHPEKAKSLTLLSTWAQADDRFRATILSIGDLVAKLSGRDFHNMVLPWMLAPETYANSNTVEATIVNALNYPYPPTPQVVFKQSRAIAASRTLDRLALIAVPTLVVVGKDDILTPPKFSEELARGISRTELKILTGAHGFIVENAAEVADVVLRFHQSISKKN